MEYTYEGLVRHSFGFANPNHAAALFSMLIPFLWGLRKIFKSKTAFASLLIPEILLYLALLATMSRAGILAVIPGAAFFFYLTHKHQEQRLDKKSLCLIVLTLVSAFFILCSFGILKRYYTWMSIPDDSMLNRFILWQGGLQIIADNLQGVGTGLSGRIFTDFYQPMGSTLTFRTMVNSFLTFIVEQGIFPSVILCFFIILTVVLSIKALQKTESQFKKIAIISLLTGCFCAFVSGMTSTCFDYSVIKAFCISLFSNPRMIDLNSAMQTLLFFIPPIMLVSLLLLSLKYFNRAVLRFSSSLSLSASAVLFSGIILSGASLNSSRNESCEVFNRENVKWVKICPKDKISERILLLPDEKLSGRRNTVNFFRLKYERYAFEIPLFSISDAENLFKDYDAAVLCGDNIALAESDLKTKFIFYFPISPPTSACKNITKVYLSRFDEYGCNKQWEKLSERSKSLIEYLQ